MCIPSESPNRGQQMEQRFNPNHLFSTHFWFRIQRLFQSRGQDGLRCFEHEARTPTVASPVTIEAYYINAVIPTLE
jgi:hypothetical protein